MSFFSFSSSLLSLRSPLSPLSPISPISPHFPTSFSCTRDRPAHVRGPVPNTSSLHLMIRDHGPAKVSPLIMYSIFCTWHSTLPSFDIAKTFISEKTTPTAVVMVMVMIMGMATAEDSSTLSLLTSIFLTHLHRNKVATSILVLSVPYKNLHSLSSSCSSSSSCHLQPPSS